MAYALSSVLTIEEEDIREVTPAHAVLLRRLGVESLPAHETMILPTERLVVAGAERLARSAKRLVKSIQHVGILQNPSVVVQGGVDSHDLHDGHNSHNRKAIHDLRALDDLQASETTFEVIAGRRRGLAAGLAGLPVVKCEVYAASTQPLSALIALIENEQRSAAWVREVEALRCLMDEGVGMTLDDLAAFGFDRATLAERLKMAQLPAPLLNRILAGDVSRDVARKLTRLTQTQQERIVGLAAAGEEIRGERVKDILRAQINAGLVPIQTELAQGWNAPPSHSAALSPRVALPNLANPADPEASSAQLRLTSRGGKEQAEQATSAGEEAAQESGSEVCSIASTSSQFSSLAVVLDALHAFEQSTDYQTAPRTVQTLTQALVQQLRIALRDMPPAPQPQQAVQPVQSQSRQPTYKGAR